MAAAPTLRRVVPLAVTAGEAGGHRLDLLSLECWDRFTDLRYGRTQVDPGARPLPRRVPPTHAWQVEDDRGNRYLAIDAVGRGDRGFSNGEVRLQGPLAEDATRLTVTVDLGVQGADGTLTATIDLPVR